MWSTLDTPERMRAKGSRVHFSPERNYIISLSHQEFRAPRFTISWANSSLSGKARAKVCRTSSLKVVASSEAMLAACQRYISSEFETELFLPRVGKAAVNLISPGTSFDDPCGSFPILYTSSQPSCPALAQHCCEVSQPSSRHEAIGEGKLLSKPRS